ncbi:MAG: hypothetical protein CVV61_03555 [Tenericutes bacterium HGW-Tenericutes-6]|nr:MAG: hypothetical protein CVV61_03555 [Tenericutes bacterium HGW-Tenericutes-6]
MDPVKTGLFIQTLRKERRLTQQELAELLLVTNKAISRWETGEGFPDVVILPRLSEVLGVSVDEILAGSYLRKAESNILTQSYKLKNTLLLTKVIMFLSFVLFLGLTYSTYKVWIGFLGYVLPSTLGLTWLFIQRSNYIESCLYDEEDRIIIFKALKESLTMYICFFIMSLPQLIAIGSMGQWVNGVLNIGTYGVYATFLGSIFYLGLSYYFYHMFEQGKYQIYEPRIIRKILIYTITLYIILFSIYVIIGYNHVLDADAFIVVLMSSVHTIYMIILIRMKKASLKHLLALLGLSFILLYFIIGEANGFILNAIIVLYFVLTLTFLVISLIKLNNGHIDGWFYVFYQNLWLYLFVFLFTTGAILVFVIMYVAYVLIDIFVISKKEMIMITEQTEL